MLNDYEKYAKKWCPKSVVALIVVEALVKALVVISFFLDAF
jgi:hypothetical protein